MKLEPVQITTGFNEKILARGYPISVALPFRKKPWRLLITHFYDGMARKFRRDWVITDPENGFRWGYYRFSTRAEAVAQAHSLAAKITPKKWRRVRRALRKEGFIK